MEDLQYDRKIELNEWLINARWFYMVAVFLIGILGNSLMGVLNYNLAFASIFLLLIILIFINAYFYYAITAIKKSRSIKHLRWLSLWQIIIELIVFAIIMKLCPENAMVSIFYFLPIISASIIFGLRGAILTALVASGIVNFSAITDYLIYLVANFFHKEFFTIAEINRFQQKTIYLVQAVTTSNFYLVVGIFAGYSSKLLYRRERALMTQAEELIKISQSKEYEIKKLDQATKLLAKRDTQLTIINKELDKKLQELERSEKSLMKAFADLKVARQKTDEESNKIVAMVANFIDPIIVIDKNNRLSLLNPAAREVFGLIEADVGRLISSNNNYSMLNFKEIIKKDYQVKTSKELKSENPLEEEAIIRTGRQESTYKVITEKIIDKRGEDLGVMKIFYNLTREKMIDKLKSEFISIAAHQLRTPLSAIKWVIKMILDGDAGKLNEEQKSLLLKGYESNERIINLVNDMLNVSRIEEGRFGFSFSECNFSEVLNIVLESLENQIKANKIKLIKDIPKKMPKVYMDKEKMILVLQNLLENAVKYTPEFGKIEIGAEFGKEFMKFRVKDNGVGIPRKDQAKLFSKFFRADNVVRMQTEGSGLGLFIVKNIIDRHGGDITFQSEEGRGTEFVFTLPLH